MMLRFETSLKRSPLLMCCKQFDAYGLRCSG